MVAGVRWNDAVWSTSGQRRMTAELPTTSSGLVTLLTILEESMLIYRLSSAPAIRNRSYPYGQTSINRGMALLQS